MGIAQQEGRKVNQYFAFAFGLCFEAPEDRRGEGFCYGAPLVGVIAYGAVVVVGLLQQYFGAAAHELHDAVAPELVAVESDIVRAHSCCEGVDIQELAVPFVYFNPDFSFLVVPIVVEVAGIGFHAFGFIGDGRELGVQAAQDAEHKESYGANSFHKVDVFGKDTKFTHLY